MCQEWYDRDMKKLTISQIQKKLWVETRRVADIIYPSVNGITYCYICSKPISGSNKQLSHLIPKSVCGAFLKYDVYRNLKWCCYNCNINLGGNLAEYYRKMLAEHGQEYMDNLFLNKQKMVKAYDLYVELLDIYKNIV